MKLYALYNPNKQIAKLIGSLVTVDTLIGNKAPEEINPKDITEPDFKSYKDSHVIEITIDEETNLVSNVAFTEQSMNHLNIGQNRVKQRRDNERGASLKELTGKPTAVIMRAVDSFTNTFKPMDYVILNDKFPKLQDILSAKDELLDIDDAQGSTAKRLLWTGHHAQSMAASYNRDQHVIACLVSSKDVYQATNSDEYFYDGSVREGKVLLSFDEFGSIKEDKPNKSAVLTR